MYTCALLKYQNQTNCQWYHMSFSKFSTIVSSFWFFFSSVSDNFFCRDLIFTTEWVDLCIFINVLYIFLATSTMLIIQGRSFNNRNTVVWPSTLSEVSKSLVTFAEIWGFFSCFPVTLARFSFSPLDSILQTGHNQYLHAISLQHQPGCFTGTLSVLFISRLGCDLFLYRTSTVSC